MSGVNGVKSVSGANSISVTIVRSLAAGVLLPYVKLKLDRLFDGLRNQDSASLSRFQRCFVDAYPNVSMSG
jgi:hypothetical protein